jgi:hypothetical protein
MRCRSGGPTNPIPAAGTGKGFKPLGRAVWFPTMAVQIAKTSILLSGPLATGLDALQDGRQLVKLGAEGKTEGIDRAQGSEIC